MTLNARFLLVGGKARTRAVALDEWKSFEKGVIARLDLESGALEPALEHHTPSAWAPDEEPSILFKAAAVWEDRFYVCTQTEVLIFSLPSLRVLHHFSHPCLNDAHHCRPGRCPDTVLVANTGLDMVVELDMTGKLIEAWSVLGEDPWARFDRNKDYRKVHTTKPHSSHPNYVFTHGDEIWATRFHQRDVVKLGATDIRIPVEVQGPHDGIRGPDGLIHVTTVDAHLVALDMAARRVVRVTDLNPLMPGLRKPGWCRGLAFLDADHALIGFSRLRPTIWQNNLNWVKGTRRSFKMLRRQPSMVGLFNLSANRLVRTYPIDDVGLNAIFSIHPLP